MKGDIPKSVKVDNSTYAIIKTHNLVDDDGVKVYGLTTFDKQLIEIDADLGEDLTRNTLLHEINHCIFFERGIHDTIKEDEVFETIIDESAKGTIRALNDNKELRDYLVVKTKRKRKVKADA